MRYWTLALIVGCSGRPDVAVSTQPLCQQGGDCPCPGSPIVIDVAGDGVKLTGWEDGVDFALRPGWSKSRISWTAPGADDAWLVLDRNGNGLIEDGSEMFGNFTPQVPAAGEMRNGFVALARLDDNGDGVVDARDRAFTDLRLWRDKNHDGVSQPQELFTLPSLGVLGLSVVYTESALTDAFGNRFRYRAMVYEASNSHVGMWAWDVWLTGTQPSAPEVSGAGVLADGEPCMQGPCQLCPGPNCNPPACIDCITGVGCTLICTGKKTCTMLTGTSCQAGPEACTTPP